MTRTVIFPLALLLLLLQGCGSAPVQEQGLSEPFYTAQRILPEDLTLVSEVHDPWKPMNRRIYSFNYHFDRYVFLPVVRGYEFVFPGFVRQGVHNFFNNWRDLRTVWNSVLQLSPSKTFQASGRVIVNSTVGLLGLVDVATSLDMPRPQEDFGQTLGRWGVGTGPFLVVPVFGPSNLRDGIGLIPDALAMQEIRKELTSTEAAMAMSIGDAIDTRAHVPFRYFETGSPFEYETVRWLITTKRQLDVER